MNDQKDCTSGAGTLRWCALHCTPDPCPEPPAAAVEQEPAQPIALEMDGAGRMSTAASHQAEPTIHHFIML